MQSRCGRSAYPRVRIFCLSRRWGCAIMRVLSSFGAVAQLVEHHVRNVGVRGSNPLRSTILSGMSPSSGRGFTPRPFGLYAAPQATCAREAGEVSQGRGGREARVAGELTAKTQGGADVRAASPDVASAITARPTLTKPKFTRSAAATASRVGASANSSPRNGSAKSPSSATTEAGRCASKPPQQKPLSPPCSPSTKPNPQAPAPERGGFLSSSFP